MIHYAPFSVPRQFYPYFFFIILSDKIDTCMEGPLVLEWWSYQQCVSGRMTDGWEMIPGGQKGVSSQSLPDKKPVAMKEKPDFSPVVAEHLTGEKQILIFASRFYKEAHFDTSKIRLQMKWACLSSQALYLKHLEYMDFSYNHIPLSNE